MSSALLELVIAFLMPHFIGAARDPADARSEIIDTLADYATRTRSELLHAAHIIAFSMTTLETLAAAKAPDMSAAMRLRYRSCANGLARAMQQSEQALARSLACEAQAAVTAPSQLNDPPDSKASDAVSSRSRLPNARPAPPDSASPQTREERTKQVWAGAMMAALRQMPMQPMPLGNPLAL